MTAEPTLPCFYYRGQEVSVVIGVNISTIYRWVAKGSFPAPYQLGERAVAWRVDEVHAWLESRSRITQPGQIRDMMKSKNPKQSRRRAA